ncbi:MAG TPA: hypothetical protein PKE64_26915, partial [Anaerolineae bacterium]|nr:hypothetical protein [Anaerolineae bacterium]
CVMRVRVDSIWAVVDAVAAKRTKVALEGVASLLADREPALRILGLVARQIRIVARFKAAMADLAERGQTRHNIEFFRVERLAGQPRRAIHGAAQPRLAERMLTSYSPALRGGTGSGPLPLGSRYLGLAPPHRHNSRRLHQRPNRYPPNPNHDTSILAEDSPDAIRPFW